MNEYVQKNEFFTSFPDEQLILSCIDFVIPSLLALPATITLLIQQICHEPDMQRKIQEEIDRVIGQSRAPTLDDRVEFVFIHFISPKKKKMVLWTFAFQNR